MSERDTRRLAERFDVGEPVEIRLRTLSGERWVVGTVIHHQPPGVWVETGPEQQWFVTNGRRIRPRPGE